MTIYFTTTEIEVIKKFLLWEKLYLIKFEFYDGNGNKLKGGQKHLIAKLLSIDKWADKDYENWRNRNYTQIKKFDSSAFPIIRRFVDEKIGILKFVGKYYYRGEEYDLYERNMSRLKEIWKQTSYFQISKFIIDEDVIVSIEKKLF